MNFNPNIPNLILLIRPKNFGFNAMTAASNSFQNKSSLVNINQTVLSEFNAVVNIFEENEIAVKVVEDLEIPLPDAIFPNNWISHLPEGIITIYPMSVSNRRAEVRDDIIDWMKTKLKPSQLIDLRKNVEANQFLEGTGSIIFDHLNRIAFACESPRTNVPLFERYCNHIGYRPISFESVDLSGHQIYHTNVMMSLGTKFCIINLESIQNTMERSFLKVTIEQTGREIIPISYPQMNHFAANALEVADIRGNCLLVISKTAVESLSQAQIDKIEVYAKLVIVDVSLIEKIGGGGIRCMMAGLFTPNTKQIQI